MMLGGDIVIAADTARFCQMESKRGIAPRGGAHFRFLTCTGWGKLASRRSSPRTRRWGIQVMKESALKYTEAAEAVVIAMLPQIRERVLGTGDAKEGIRSFVERRAANFQGR